MDREREERERKKRELRCQFEEEEEEHHHLPLLVVQRPRGTAVLLRRHEFPTRFCSKSAAAVKYYQRSGLVMGLASYFHEPKASANTAYE